MTNIQFNIDTEIDDTISPIFQKSNFQQVTQRDSYINKYFVDMGLPSRALWCRYNLGANLENLNNANSWVGDYYAWGETKVKETYFPENYEHNANKIQQYINPNIQMYYNQFIEFSKYNKYDRIDSLSFVDDAAFINNPYRESHIDICIPTVTQIDELIDNSNIEYRNNYNDIVGLNGVLLTSKYNCNEFFIPVCRYKIGDKVVTFTDNGSDIYIVSKNVGVSGSGEILYEYFCKTTYSDSNYFTTIHFTRTNGYQIRPIMLK